MFTVQPKIFITKENTKKMWTEEQIHYIFLFVVFPTNLAGSLKTTSEYKYLCLIYNNNFTYITYYAIEMKHIVNFGSSGSLIVNTLTYVKFIVNGHV